MPFKATLNRARELLGNNGQVVHKPPQPAAIDSLPEEDENPQRSVVRALQKHVREVEMQAQQQKLRAEKAEKELIKVKKFSSYIVRQAEEFQEERDQALEKLSELTKERDKLQEELAQNRREQEARLNDISQEVEEALRRGRSRLGAAGVAEAGQSSLAQMDEAELREELSSLGLSQEGSVAMLRVRLRSARLLKRDSHAGDA